MGRVIDGNTAPEPGEGGRFQVIFNRVVLVLDYLRAGPLRKVDPKLFNSLVSLVVARALAALFGADFGDDPVLGYIAPLIVAAIVGYFTENAGTPEAEGDPGEPDTDPGLEESDLIDLDDATRPSELKAALPPDERD